MTTERLTWGMIILSALIAFIGFPVAISISLAGMEGNDRVFIAAIDAAVTPALVHTPLDYGAIGDGRTDDTLALQKSIDNTPDFQELDFPSNCKFLVSNSIKIYNRQGLVLKGLGGVGSSATTPGQSGAAIVWNSPSVNAVPIIDCQSSRGVEIDHLAIISQGAFPPSIGVNFDNLATGGTVVTTNNTIRNCSIINPLPDSGFIGVAINLSASPQRPGSNCDFIRVRDSSIQCSNVFTPGKKTGIGISIGASYNAKGEEFSNVQLGYANIGIYIGGGTCLAHNCSGAWVDIPYSIGKSLGGPIVLEGGVAGFENPIVAIVNQGSNSPVTLRNHRFASINGTGYTTPGLVDVHQGATGLLLEGNSFSTTASGFSLFAVPPGGTSTGSTVVSKGLNWFPVPNPNMAIYPAFTPGAGDSWSPK